MAADEGIVVGSWMSPVAAERETSFRVLDRLCTEMAAREFSENEAEVLVDMVLSGNGHQGLGWWMDGVYSNGSCSEIRLCGSVPQSIRAVIESRDIVCSQITGQRGRQGGPIHQRRKKKLWWSPRPGEVGWAEAMPLAVGDSDRGVWRLYICHYQAEPSARIAYDLGLLDKPKWNVGIYNRDAGRWPHRGKVEFSFLPKEFTLTMAKWLVELIFSASAPKYRELDKASDQWLIENFPTFLAVDERRTNSTYRDSSYMWTIDAEAVAKTALVRR